MGNLLNKKRKIYEQGADILAKDIIKDIVSDILLIAKDVLKKPISELVVLDIGCGDGTYAKELSKHTKFVVGVEPYKQLFLRAKQNEAQNLKFYNQKIENFSSDKRFDLALSLTTIEHMPNATESFKQVFKLLKPGGVLYMTAPNKLWPIEPHYNLPFINLLPIPVASFLIRLLKRGESFEDSAYAMTYWQLKKFIEIFTPEYQFITPEPDSSYIGFGTTNYMNQTVKRLGIRLIKRLPVFWAISKGFIIVARKV